jgi:uncharacterized membrane protein
MPSKCDAFEESFMPGCSFAMPAGWGGWPGIPVGLILLAAIAYILFFRSGDAKRRNADREDSLAILQRRLAAGEITLEEFLNLKRHL